MGAETGRPSPRFTRRPGERWRSGRISGATPKGDTRRRSGGGRKQCVRGRLVSNRGGRRQRGFRRSDGRLREWGPHVIGASALAIAGGEVANGGTFSHTRSVRQAGSPRSTSTRAASWTGLPASAVARRPPCSWTEMGSSSAAHSRRSMDNRAMGPRSSTCTHAGWTRGGVRSSGARSTAWSPRCCGHQAPHRRRLRECRRAAPPRAGRARLGQRETVVVARRRP